MMSFIICSFSSLLSIIIFKSRRMRLVRHVARTGGIRNAYRVLVGNRNGKILLGRCRCRRQSNINMDLKKLGEGCGLDSFDSG
jgi:hypothetical protein